MRVRVRHEIPRRLILGILLCLAASTAACDGDRVSELEAENAELRDRVRQLEIGIETLNSDLQQIDSSVSQLQDAADDLEEDVSRFDGENWRDVVPDVTTHSSDVSGALEDLKSNMEMLDHHLSGLY